MIIKAIATKLPALIQAEFLIMIPSVNFFGSAFKHSRGAKVSGKQNFLAHFSKLLLLQAAILMAQSCLDLPSIIFFSRYSQSYTDSSSI